VILIILNTVALVAGVVIATRNVEPLSWAFPIAFSLIVFAMASVLAYALNIPRVFYYGVMIAIAPVIGEWLFRNGYAAHHGFPVVYGVTSIAIAATGITKFALLLKRHAPVAEGVSADQDHA
jgi:hypothetical protein